MKLCAHCRAPLDRKAIKWDHVPPDNLFPKGTVGKIQVPACEQCNKGASEDDEYFRLTAMNIAASENEAAKQAGEGSLRAILHPKKERFRNHLFKKMEPVDLYSEMGLYLGRTFNVKLDLVRLYRTVSKTARGLYYHHKEDTPVPEGYIIKCYCLNNMSEAQQQPFRDVVLSPLLAQKVHEIGDGVFRYSFAFSKDCAGGAFLLGFFEWVDFLAVIANEAALADERKAATGVA